MRSFPALCAAALVGAAWSNGSAREALQSGVAHEAGVAIVGVHDGATVMEGFSRFVEGRWKTTMVAGNTVFDTWHWGPGRRSIRSMTEGTLPDGQPWRAVAVYYWHPVKKDVRLLVISSASRSVSEGTIRFDGEKATGEFDIYQIAGRRELGLRWTFEGADQYHDELLDKVPGGFTVQNEWRRVRVAAGERSPGAGAVGAKPSELLQPLERLLGRRWEGTDEAGAKAIEGTVRTAFEYVPDADAMYGRVRTGGADGPHVMDLYLYHHTGKGVLRCLALASDGKGGEAVYEGDITTVDDGRWVKVDLKGHRSDGTTNLEVRLDFEADGVLRQRVWRIEGEGRTLTLDVRHRAADR